MTGPESVPFDPPRLGRTALLGCEQSLAAYIERERGELLATGKGVALSELEKIHAAMLEALSVPDGRGTP